MKSNMNYTATCECGKLRYYNRRIANYWSHKKCNSCEKKMCVFQNMQLIYDYNNTTFTASCQCGVFCLKSKSIPCFWSQIKCSNCNNKLSVKDQNNNIIFNYIAKKPKTIQPKKIMYVQEEKVISPIKNDIFMGYISLEEINVENLTNEEIEYALETLSDDLYYQFEN
jgi:hypothetical protein